MLEDEGLVGYYNKGYKDGIQVERARIIAALKAKAEARNIFEALQYPYLITELEETIMENNNE